MRISSLMRGCFIGGLVGAFAWLANHPGSSFTVSLLVAAALQAAVLLVRRFVSPDIAPQAVHLLEMIADGVTVLLFAVGVYGGLLRAASES